KEGRLAGIGQADKSCVRDQLQPQPDPAFLADFAGIGIARSAVGGGFEMRVAKTAIAAFRKHELLAKRGEIVDQRRPVFVEDLRADRHLEHDVLAVGAMAVLAHAIGALLGLEVLLIAIVDQGVQSIDHFDDHVAAASAIAAGGAAELDILLAAEGHAAVSTVAGADIDLGFVEKFHEATRRAGALLPHQCKSPILTRSLNFRAFSSRLLSRTGRSRWQQCEDAASAPIPKFVSL